MNSMPNPTTTDPNDELAARADGRLAHAYEQIARADEQLARVTEHLSQLDRDAGRKPSARPSRGRPVLRGLSGLLLAACIFFAAFAWQSSRDDAAKQRIARWVAQFGLTSSPPLTTTGLSAQPSSSAARLVAAQPTSPTVLAQTAPQEAVPAAAPPSPELTQTIQTMARDLAIVARGIEQLKAGQEQITSDNARAIEQLKAGQDQMARDNAKAVEQLKAMAMASSAARASKPGVPPTTAAPPPRNATAAPTRQPVPTRPPPQARTTQQ